MTTPVTTVGLDPVSSICATGHPSFVLTGIFTRALQDHFANPDNLEFNGKNEFVSSTDFLPKTQLQGYIWTNDNTTTNIQIQPVWLYNPEDIQRRPAVYVKRNALQPQRLAIDDGMTVNSRRDASGKVIGVRGEYHSVMVLGSHTVFCVGNSGGEAELLSAEVTSFFMSFAPLMRRVFGFHRVAVAEVGEVSLLEEHDQHFVVPVVVSYAFAETWRLNLEAPWLKTLSIDVRPSQGV